MWGPDCSPGGSEQEEVDLVSPSGALDWRPACSSRRFAKQYFTERLEPADLPRGARRSTLNDGKMNAPLR